MRGNIDIEDLLRDLKSTDKRIRDYAIKMLSKVANSTYLIFFIRQLHPAQWRWKVSATQALSKIGDELAIEKLKTLLLDIHPKVHNAAKKGLEKLGILKAYSNEEIMELISFLEHPNWWVRANASSALTSIGDKRAIKPIARLLDDEDEVVRETAKKSLSKFRKFKKTL